MPSDPLPVEVQASERVFRLSDFALNLQLGTVRTTGSTADPILVLEYGEERKVYRLVGTDLETAIRALQDNLLSDGAQVDAYALAYDARILYGEEKYDVIIAEVGELGNKVARRFGQRYRHKRGFWGKFELVGPPMYLGETESRQF